MKKKEQKICSITYKMKFLRKCRAFSFAIPFFFLTFECKID